MENKVKNSKKNKRIDKYLSADFSDYPRSFLKKLILENKVKVNNKNVKPSYILNEDDKIDFETNIEEEYKNEKKQDYNNKKIVLDIIYEDEYLIVLNKKAGDMVHRSANSNETTISDQLIKSSKKLSNYEKDPKRVGVLHRLDKNTSGLMLFVKEEESHKLLKEQLKSRNIKRIYKALCVGIARNKKGIIDVPLKKDANKRFMMIPSNEGKEAITHFKVVKTFKNNTLLECKLKTGRTHQIRAHLSFISHPIVNDVVYGKKDERIKGDFHLLHSSSLTFIHPKTKKEMTFKAPLPDYFNNLIQNMD